MIYLGTVLDMTLVIKVIYGMPIIQEGVAFGHLISRKIHRNTYKIRTKFIEIRKNLDEFLPDFVRLGRHI